MWLNTCLNPYFSFNFFFWLFNIYTVFTIYFVNFFVALITTPCFTKYCFIYCFTVSQGRYFGLTIPSCFLQIPRSHISPLPDANLLTPIGMNCNITCPAWPGKVHRPPGFMKPSQKHQLFSKMSRLHDVNNVIFPTSSKADILEIHGLHLKVTMMERDHRAVKSWVLCLTDSCFCLIPEYLSLWSYSLFIM